MPSLSVMLKPASGMCNLACKYCFYGDVSTRRVTSNLGKMSSDAAQRVIASALEYADRDEVYFTFQGGEPLLAGIEFFENFVAAVKRLNEKNSTVILAVQTNGTLIDDRWAKFFSESGFLVGLSLDGSFEYNKNRVDSVGAPSFHRILAAARLLRENGVDFNVLSVVTAKSASAIEKIYEYLKSKDFRYLQFIPCLRPLGESCRSGDMYMTAEQYAAFLTKLFKLYVRDFERGEYVSVRQLDNYVRLYRGGAAEQCGMCGHCSRQFVVEGDGSVYPCDFYCTDEWLLGNIGDTGFSELAQTKKASDFIALSLKHDERCTTCRYYMLCRGGGCKRSRDDADYCAAYRSFFRECLPLFEKFRR